ncbi:MAG TPA: ThuA domain-containing protein [bacterium]|nr:ThuA domain-containing protein [bacterium]
MTKKVSVRLIILFLVFGVLMALIRVDLVAQPAAERSIQALVITGGHDFDRPAFFAMLHGFENIEYTEVRHPKANDLYGSEKGARADVLVFYDMYDTISSRQQSEFTALLEQGAGMVFLHHSLASYQEWEEFLHVVGGRYHLEPYTEGGDTIAASTYRHDVEIPVEIHDSDHPVTSGLEDFVIHDEVYGNCQILPEVHPLLKTNHPESLPYLAWTNKYKNSRIVYIQLGHDAHAYRDPNYQRLVRQAIIWTAID